MFSSIRNEAKGNERHGRRRRKGSGGSQWGLPRYKSGFSLETFFHKIVMIRKICDSTHRRLFVCHNIAEWSEWDERPAFAEATACQA